MAPLTCDVSAGEQRNLTQGPPNAAPHVQHLVPRLEPQAQRQVVLVAADGLAVALAVPAVGKVEGGAPACGWVSEVSGVGAGVR
jgi:hypothetical protein